MVYRTMKIKFFYRSEPKIALFANPLPTNGRMVDVQTQGKFYMVDFSYYYIEIKECNNGKRLSRKYLIASQYMAPIKSEGVTVTFVNGDTVEVSIGSDPL